MSKRVKSIEEQELGSQEGKKEEAAEREEVQEEDEAASKAGSKERQMVDTRRITKNLHGLQG